MFFLALAPGCRKREMLPRIKRPQGPWFYHPQVWVSGTWAGLGWKKNRYSISMVISYSGEGYLFAKALLGLPKPHGNPTQTLCFPSVCLGLARVFDGSSIGFWWHLLLAGHSPCGSRPPHRLSGGPRQPEKKKCSRKVFLTRWLWHRHQAFFQFLGAIYGSMGGFVGVWWRWVQIWEWHGGLVGVWCWYLKQNKNNAICSSQQPKGMDISWAKRLVFWVREGLFLVGLRSSLWMWWGSSGVPREFLPAETAPKPQVGL